MHIVKSRFRQEIEELTKNSRIQKWMFATPEEDIDDPTGEIRRLKQQVGELWSFPTEHFQQWTKALIFIFESQIGLQHEAN